jgi:basic membrane protein A
MSRQIRLILCVTLGLLLVFSTGTIGAAQSENVRVGLLTGVAGLGDKSYNDLAFDGAKRAESELGITLTVIEPPDLASTEELLRQLAKVGNDLVIGVGFDMQEPMARVAQEFPKTGFAIVDAVVDNPNVASLVFKEHEGSFLVGALAAMMTDTQKVGAIPAMDIPFLNRFTKAYEQGALYVDPSVEVYVQPIGSDFSAFNDPAKAQEIALSMYSKGVDVIYHAAGGAGQGLFNAAKQVGKYAIGCNSDQDYMAEGLVLSSMMKRVDEAVFDTIRRMTDGSFKGGVVTYGLSNNGIGLTPMTYTRDIIGDDNISSLDQIRKDIISGKIVVIDAADE